MSAIDAPPPIPTEFQIYNSYAVDPTYQRKFSIIWASAAGAAILYSLPHLLNSIRKGYTWSAITGIKEDLSGAAYEPLETGNTRVKAKSARKGGLERVHGVIGLLKSLSMWTAPHVGLDLGQVFLVVAYTITILLCITLNAELIDNPNRAGFMAIAQLPFVFLLATKNSLLSLALGAGVGWEKLNFLHRWAGRLMFLAAAVHGSLWIKNHLEYDLPILGQQKETSGVACFGLLCAIVLSSLKPVRVLAYQLFFIVHILAFVAFFITLCYHTIYARPYIFPPLAFYGLDLLLRMFRFRVKDATLFAPDQQMTVIRVQDSDGGWTPGQFVRLRVFFSGRVFESHPLTICNAPSNITCLSDRALLLGARANGDWSKALNAYALANATTSSTASEKAVAESAENSDIVEVKAKAELDDEDSSVSDHVDYTDGAQVQVMLDGPYGGCSIDVGEYERVFLVAGGSGITFVLGILDDLVGRCIRLQRRGGERTRRVEVAWCIRSFGCLRWFAPQLTQIALAAERDPELDLRLTVFVTCYCAPEAVPPIPNCEVLVERPQVRRLLDELVGKRAANDSKEGGAASKGVDALDGGGLAVCAAGPESMAREAKNALARVAFSSGGRLGRIGCHTEAYSL